MTKKQQSNSELISKRSSCLAIIDVNACNPNGDPDGEGSPRQFPNNRGWISAVSQKRKYRDLLVDHESPLFRDIVGMSQIDPEKFHIFESLRRGSDLEDPVKAAAWVLALSEDQILSKFHDVRVFGTTALEESKDEKGKKKEGDTVKLKKTGPITFSTAISIAPVVIEESAITKKAPFRDDLLEKGNGDIAPSGCKMVLHGLYCANIVVNPHLARETKTTEEDIDLFKMIFRWAFSSSTSSSRPAGSISFHRLWWADHTNALGSFNEQEFFSALTPKKNGEPEEPSNSIADYDIPMPAFNFQVTDLVSGKVYGG